MMVVSAASKKERCDLCESKSALRTVKDLRVCPTCQNLMAHVNNRLDLLISVIKQRHPERIAELLGAAASVTVESEALQQIADLIGYRGTDGDGLIEAVKVVFRDAEQGFSVQKSVSQDVVRALDCGEDEWELAAIQSAAYMGKYRRELKASELLLDHIADVVSYPGKEAGSLPEFIERVCHEFETALADLSKIKTTIGFDVEDDSSSVVDSVSLLAQTLDQYRGRCEELVAKAREHEQLGSYREQILMACRDALGMPLISVGDLPRIIEEKLLELELWSSKQNVSPGHDVLTPVITSLDSHLLDLALECMRGEIIGLHPDQIALLREAV
jgi:hypothetical protein